MKYVLIMIIWAGSNSSTVTAEFDDADACEAARSGIVQTLQIRWNGRVSTDDRCVPKNSKPVATKK